MFGPDDLKILVEVAIPIGSAVWYLRGILVKLELTLGALGERIGKAEKATSEHDNRIRRIELVHARHFHNSNRE
jgi:hypothetical protein